MFDATRAETSDPSVDAVCSLLRAAAPTPGQSIDEIGVPWLLDTARIHGVSALLDWTGATTHSSESWPEALRQACHEDAVAQAMRELATRAETLRILDALGRADIHPLLMKGTGLAYSHYPSPALRPRADCDLLIALPDRDAARETLRHLGYRRISGPAGAYVGYQIELHYDDPRGVTHNLDLHWRISNVQSFARLFTFKELASEATPVPSLGPEAQQLGDMYALMLALLHRSGNNLFLEPGFGDRLIWLYDIHLLVEAMGDADLGRFRRLAEEKRLVAIAIEGLRRCAGAFGSSRVDALAGELDRSPVAESGSDLLRAGILAREWIEFRAVRGTTARATYVANRLLPSAEYMRERFPEAAGRALPLLHARRWLDGFRRRMPPNHPDEA